MKKIETFYDFVKDIEMVMQNNIMEVEPDYGEPQYHPQDEESGEYAEIYQYYIINENDAQYLIQQAEEHKYKSYAIYYNAHLNMYVMGVTHWGTRWGAVDMY